MEHVQTLEKTVTPILEAEAASVDAEGLWPKRSIDALRSSGLLGLTLPKESGGSGAGMREFVAVNEKIAASCASTAMIYLMHTCGAQVIAAAKSPRRETLLKRIATEHALATLAFSERGSRSHFWAPVSHARRDGTSTVLNCEKSFVTSAGHADFYVTSSGSVGGEKPLDSTLYLVEKGSAGIQANETWQGIGLRGNASSSMTLSDCRVEDDNRLTAEGEGFPTMMQVALPWFQVGSSAVSLGIARAAFAAAVRHTSSARLEHMGETLASAIPGIRARLARMQLAIDSTSALLDQTLTRIESGSENAMLGILGVKAVAAEMAVQVTDEAMRACGGAAFSRNLPVERNFRDARAASIMAPTTDVLHDFIGKAVAGLPLF